MTEKTIGVAIDAVLDALTGLNEKQQEIVIMTACSTLNIGKVSAKATISESGNLALAATPQAKTVPGSISMDIRSLKQERNPASSKQMACLVHRP